MHETPTALGGIIAYSAGGLHEDLLTDCTKAIDQIEPQLRHSTSAWTASRFGARVRHGLRSGVAELAKILLDLSQRASLEELFEGGPGRGRPA